VSQTCYRVMPNKSPNTPTCGLIKTRSMNKTTKSCSTYLSAKRLQRGHCVSRTPFPRALSSALLYVVYKVLMGHRHSMHIGISSRLSGVMLLLLVAAVRDGQGVRSCCAVPGGQSARGRRGAGAFAQCMYILAHIHPLYMSADTLDS